MRLSILISASLHLFTHVAVSQITDTGLFHSELELFPEDETSCHQACTTLQQAHPDSTYYSPSPLFGFQASFYTAQQSFTIPACIITPPNALIVSSVLNIISDHSCHFTVKSGGHAPHAGASNADGGISIDLSLLHEIEILGDGDVVRVGTGNRWIDVYAKLEPLEKMVVGSRNGDVGVGGFLLGGGISHFSRRYGWACDNVLAYTLVLPNGTLTTITPTSSPDLFTALRGGGSNLGIVTSFDLQTFPQKQIFAGSNIYILPPSSITAALSSIPEPEIDNPFVPQVKLGIRARVQGQLTRAVLHTLCYFKYCTTPLTLSRAFVGALEATKGDPNAQMIFSLSWSHNTPISSIAISHTSPPLRWDLSTPPPPPPDTILRSKIDPDEIADVERAMAAQARLTPASLSKLSSWSWDQKNGFLPHIFRNFTDLSRVWGTYKVQNLTERLVEVRRSDPRPGLRQHWSTLTFHLPSKSNFTAQAQLLAQMIDIWIQETAHVHHVPSIEPTILFQPLYPEFISHSLQNGGNAMKIDPRPEKGPLLLLSLIFAWENIEDDEIMITAGDEILVRVRELCDTTLASADGGGDGDGDGDEGLSHEFVYHNYASPSQDVFASYGETWREHLRALQESVDSQGTWRRLKRGGFVV